MLKQIESETEKELLTVHNDDDEALDSISSTNSVSNSIKCNEPPKRKKRRVCRIDA